MRNIVFFFLLMFLVCLSCKSRNTEHTIEPAARVRVAGITTGEISIPVHSAGILSSSEEVKLSFKTGGIIGSINVREGEKVKSGTLLASLDPSEIDAAVRQAENGYEKALRDHNRAENLYRDSVVTLEVRQNSATALDVARSVLDVARFNRKHARIYAPTDGIVLRQLARQNELVSAGFPVFLFGSSGKFWKVRAALSDRNVVKISNGDTAIVTLDAYPGVTFPAVVDLVGEASNPYTGTFDTELLLNASGYRMASGFIANVDIFPSVKSSFALIPLGALVEADGQEGYIYAVSDSSKVSRIKIRIEGIRGEKAAVSGIPSIYSEIVSEGAAYLREGMKVEIVK